MCICTCYTGMPAWCTGIQVLYIPVGRAAPHTKLPHTFGAGGRTSATDYAVSSLCGRVQRGTVAPGHCDCSTADAEAELARRINDIR